MRNNLLSSVLCLLSARAARDRRWAVLALLLGLLLAPAAWAYMPTSYTKLSGGSDRTCLNGGAYLVDSSVTYSKGLWAGDNVSDSNPVVIYFKGANTTLTVKGPQETGGGRAGFGLLSGRTLILRSADGAGSQKLVATGAAGTDGGTGGEGGKANGFAHGDGGGGGGGGCAPGSGIGGDGGSGGSGGRGGTDADDGKKPDPLENGSSGNDGTGAGTLVVYGGITVSATAGGNGNPGDGGGSGDWSFGNSGGGGGGGGGRGAASAAIGGAGGGGGGGGGGSHGGVNRGFAGGGGGGWYGKGGVGMGGSRESSYGGSGYTDTNGQGGSAKQGKYWGGGGGSVGNGGSGGTIVAYKRSDVNGEKISSSDEKGAGGASSFGGVTINFDLGDMTSLVSGSYDTYTLGNGGNIYSVPVTPPTSTGADFLGYYTQSNGGGDKIFDKDGKVVNTSLANVKDNKIYANWSYKQNVTAAVNGHKIMDSAGHDILKNDVSGASYDAANKVLTLSGANASFTLSGASDADLPFRVEVTANANVTLSGLTLTPAQDVDCITFTSKATDAKLVLTGDSKVYSQNNYAAVCVDSGANVTLSGSATLAGGKAANVSSRCVYIRGGGQFVMNGGAICDYYTTDNGGAVYNNDTFTMNGGTISSCTAKYGGALLNNGTAKIYGGTVCNNEATGASDSNGGFCHDWDNANCHTYIYGGCFSGNKAKDGYCQLFAGYGNKKSGYLYGGVFAADPTTSDESGGCLAKMDDAGVTQVGTKYVVGKDVVSKNSQLTGGTYTFNPTNAEYVAAGVTVNGNCVVAGLGTTPETYLVHLPTSFRINGSPLSEGSGTGWSFDSANWVLTLHGVNEYALTGDCENLPIKVDVKAANATITLTDVKLRAAAFDREIFNVTASKVHLALGGTNEIYTTDGHAAISVAEGAELTLSGDGALVGGKTANANGRCVTVATGGALVMEGGTIHDYYTTVDGGAVYNDGTFTVYGGTIAGNKGREGGALFNNGTAKIHGGTVTNNVATDYGGFCYDNNNRHVSIYGGYFSGNTAPSGRCNLFHCYGWQKNGSLYGGVFAADPITSDESGSCLVLTNDAAVTKVNGKYVVGQNVTQEDDALTGGTYTFDPERGEYAAAGVKIARNCIVSPQENPQQEPRVTYAVVKEVEFMVNGTRLKDGPGDGWTVDTDDWTNIVLTLAKPQPYVLTGFAARKLKVDVTANATVTLNDIVIHPGALGRAIFDVTAADAKFVLKGKNEVYTTDGYAAVCVSSGAKLTVTGDELGGELVGGKARSANGRGFYVYGELVLESGLIRDYYTTDNGGAVYNAGTFTMNGGEIADCKAKSCAGAICNYGTLDIYGGTIRDCSTDGWGGALATGPGYYIRIYGGCFAGNTAKNGCDFLDEWGGAERQYAILFGGLWDKDPTPGNDVSLQDGAAVTQVGSNWIVGKGVTQMENKLTGGTYTFDPGSKAYELLLTLQSGYRSVEVAESNPQSYRVLYETAFTVNGQSVSDGSGAGWKFENDVLTLSEASGFVLSGSDTSRLRVEVTANANVTLENLTLVNSSGKDLITFTRDATDAKLTLMGANTVYGTANAIRVQSGANLTVQEGSTDGCLIGSGDGNTGKRCIHNDGTLTLSSGTIKNYCPSSSDWVGGAIYNNGTFAMEGGTLSGCSASEKGGAVYNDGTFTMNGGTISGNKAKYGGALLNNGTARIYGGTVIDNAATGASDSNGGFCHDWDNADCHTYIYGGCFSGNKAPKGYCQLFVGHGYKHSGYLYGGVFDADPMSSAESGDNKSGSCLVLQSDAKPTQVGNNWIVGKDVKSLSDDTLSGGTYTFDPSRREYSDMGLNLARFRAVKKDDGKTIDQYPYEVYLKWKTGVTIQVGGITNDLVHGEGTGWSFSEKDHVLTLGENAQQGPFVLSGDTCEGDVDVPVKGVSVVAGAHVEFKDLRLVSKEKTVGVSEVKEALVVFEKDSGISTLTLTGTNAVCTSENDDADWSAILVESGATLTVKGDGTMRRDPAASGHCRGFEVEGSLVLEEGVVTGYKAKNYGGGVIALGGNFEMSGGALRGNSAAAGGGGVASGITDVRPTSEIVLSGGEISENTTSANGGGVFFKGTMLTLSDGIRIADNNAKGNGGGVSVEDGLVEVKGGTFSGNTAANGGSAIWSAKKSGDAEDVKVLGGVFTNTVGTAFARGNLARLAVKGCIADSAPSDGVLSAGYKAVQIPDHTPERWAVGTNVMADTTYETGFTSGTFTFDPELPCYAAEGMRAGDGAVLHADVGGGTWSYVRNTGHRHCLCGAKDCTAHDKDSCWAPWDGPAGTLPDRSGHWFLTNDVALAAEWFAPTNVALCLNGKNVTRNGRVANLASGKLVITDCNATPGTVSGVGKGANGACVYMPGGATFDLYRVTLTGTGANYGGAVYLCDNCTFNMYSGAIEGCSANAGGGVFADGGTTVVLSGGAITNCSAGFGGGICSHGLLKITGGEICFNKSDCDGNGVQMHNETACLEMTGGSIHDNLDRNAGSLGGGGLNLRSGVTATIMGGSITNNSTAMNGGGIRFEGTSLTIGGNALIANNTTAKDGGGVYFNGTSLAISGMALIADNIGTADKSRGGGVAVRSGTLTMTGGTVSRNLAPLGGAGIDLTSTSEDSTISGGVVADNVSLNNIGGGVCLWDLGGGRLTVSGGTFAGNSCSNNYDGSALAVWDSGKTCTVSGGIFSNNVSTASVLTSGNRGCLEVTGGVFENNVTVGDLVQIDRSAATATVKGGLFDTNAVGCVQSGYSAQALTYTENPTWYMIAQDATLVCIGGSHTNGVAGGVFACDPMRPLYVERGFKVANGYMVEESEGGTFTVGPTDHYHNLCCDETCTRHLVHGWEDIGKLPHLPGFYCLTNDIVLTETWHPANDTFLCLNGHAITNPNGRAIQLDAGVHVEITDCSTNKAPGTISGKDANGACVSIAQNAGFEFARATLKGTGATDGGAVYVYGGGTFDMHSGTIAGSSADHGGGGVFAEADTTVTIKGGTIRDCSASYGGGIRSQGTVYVKGGEISFNKSNSDGNGVQMDGNGSIEMTGGSIYGNSDKESGSLGGGGLNLRGNVIATIMGGSITNNSTAKDGGGIRFEGKSLTISDGAVIADNTASASGGGVAVKAGKLTVTGGQIGENASSGDGGGIYFNGTSLAISGTALIADNIGTSDKSRGGGVAVRSGTLTMTGGTVSRNLAPLGGAGIDLTSTSEDSTISGGVVADNVSLNNIGGGVSLWNTGGGKLTVSGGTFAGNSCSNNYDGSALAVWDSGRTCTVTGGTFSNNVSTASVLASGNRGCLEVIGGVFENNVFGDGLVQIISGCAAGTATVMGGLFDTSAIGCVATDAGFMSTNLTTRPGAAHETMYVVASNGAFRAEDGYLIEGSFAFDPQADIYKAAGVEVAFGVAVGYDPASVPPLYTLTHSDSHIINGNFENARYLPAVDGTNGFAAAGVDYWSGTGHATLYGKEFPDYQDLGVYSNKYALCLGRGDSATTTADVPRQGRYVLTLYVSGRENAVLEMQLKSGLVRNVSTVDVSQVRFCIVNYELELVAGKHDFTFKNVSSALPLPLDTPTSPLISLDLVTLAYKDEGTGETETERRSHIRNGSFESGAPLPQADQSRAIAPGSTMSVEWTADATGAGIYGCNADGFRASVTEGTYGLYLEPGGSVRQEIVPSIESLSESEITHYMLSTGRWYRATFDCAAKEFGESPAVRILLNGTPVATAYAPNDLTWSSTAALVFLRHGSNEFRIENVSEDGAVALVDNVTCEPYVHLADEYLFNGRFDFGSALPGRYGSDYVMPKGRVQISCWDCTNAVGLFEAHCTDRTHAGVQAGEYALFAEDGGAFSQAFTVPAAGEYRLTYSIAARAQAQDSDYWPAIVASLDGVPLGTNVATSSMSYDACAHTLVFDGAGRHTLAFAVRARAPQQAIAVDRISIRKAEERKLDVDVSGTVPNFRVYPDMTDCRLIALGANAVYPDAPGDTLSADDFHSDNTNDYFRLEPHARAYTHPLFRCEKKVSTDGGFTIAFAGVAGTNDGPVASCLLEKTDSDAGEARLLAIENENGGTALRFRAYELDDEGKITTTVLDETVVTSNRIAKGELGSYILTWKDASVSLYLNGANCRSASLYLSGGYAFDGLRLGALVESCDVTDLASRETPEFSVSDVRVYDVGLDVDQALALARGMRGESVRVTAYDPVEQAVHREDVRRIGSLYGEVAREMTREGARFLDWTLDAAGSGKEVTTLSEVIVATDHTIYANWSNLSYNVTYDFDGYPGMTNVTVRMQAGDFYAPPTGFEMTDMPVRGWKNENGAYVYSDMTFPSTASYADETLKADFTVVRATLVFDPQNGDPSTTNGLVQLGTPVASYAPSKDPIRAGYTFTGWWSAPAGGEPLTDATVLQSAHGETWYAHWLGDEHLSLWWAKDCEPAVYTNSSRTGESLVPPEVDGRPVVPVSTDDSVRFYGWGTYADAFMRTGAVVVVRYDWTHDTWDWVGDRVTPDAPSGFIALWWKTCPFDANGGVVDTARTFLYPGEPYDGWMDLPTAAREGSEFAGWRANAADGTNVFAELIVPDPIPTNLVASWQARAVVVSLDANGGTCSDGSVVVRYGEPYGALPTPERPGYRFEAWHYSYADGYDVTSETVVNTEAEHTLVASWTEAAYTVRYLIGKHHLENRDFSQVNGQPWPTLYAPTAQELAAGGVTDDQEFKGWLLEGTTNLVRAGDVATVLFPTNLVAYTPGVVCTLALDPNDGCLAEEKRTVTVNFGAAVPELPTPTREACAFKGWYTAAGTEVKEGDVWTVSGTTKLFAKWIGTTEYAMTFSDAASGTSETRGFFYLGAMPTSPTVVSPRADGGVFCGWWLGDVQVYDAHGEPVVGVTECPYQASQTLVARWIAGQDDFAGAMALTNGAHLAVYGLEGTDEPGEPDHDGEGVLRATHWYSFSGTKGTSVRFDFTDESPYEPAAALALYRGTAFADLACVEQVVTYSETDLNLEATLPEDGTYYLAVAQDQDYAALAAYELTATGSEPPWQSAWTDPATMPGATPQVRNAQALKTDGFSDAVAARVSPTNTYAQFTAWAHVGREGEEIPPDAINTKTNVVLASAYDLYLVPTGELAVAAFEMTTNKAAQLAVRLTLKVLGEFTTGGAKNVDLFEAAVGVEGASTPDGTFGTDKFIYDVEAVDKTGSTIRLLVTPIEAPTQFFLKGVTY